MQPMNQYNHLLAFDLSSYGVALAIINQFADDEAVKVFEVSPCGQSAILILLAKDANVLVILNAEIESTFKSQILASSLIENTHGDLLPTYLSQNKVVLHKSLIILEGSSVAMGLALAHKALEEKNTLVDFRVIRTFPKNVVITLTTEAPEANNRWMSLDDGFDFKKTYIENIQPLLKSYFEIVST